MKKKVSLIVLNYNGLPHLKEYFDSLFAQTLLPDEIFMMDNLSKDGSREFVKKDYPQVTIVTEDRFNTGTAMGFNIAFAKSTGTYVIFQSNDIRLDKNCVNELYYFMKKHADVGIATSVLLNYYKDNKTGKHRIDNAGGITDVLGFGMQNYPAKQIEDIADCEEVFFSYGGSCIVRRKAFEKVGGFDERFFTLNDDLDLSWRIRLSGYKVMYTKKSIVYHKVSATLGKLYSQPLKHYWSERNLIRTFLKNSSTKQLLFFLPLNLIFSLSQIVYFCLRGKFLLAFADVKALIWNILYLPQTLMLRYKIQSMKRKNNIERILLKSSLKLKLFLKFHKAL